MRAASLLVYLPSPSSRRAIAFVFVVLSCALILLALDASGVAADAPKTIDPFRWGSAN